MEALIILFAELIFACLLPVFSAVGALFAVLLELLLAVLGGGGGEKRRRPAPEAPRQRAAPQAPRRGRKWVHWTAGGLATVAVLGLVASVVAFGPVLRLVMDKAAQKTGVRVSYESAEGNLLTGRVALQGVSMARDSEEGLAFDLRLDRAEVDVAMTSLLFGDARIERAVVAGVRGTLTPPPRREDDGRPRRGARRPFVIEDLDMEDLKVEVRPRGSDSFEATIDHARVAPLRSGLAAFDLLFRSNMKAEIAGQQLEVATRELSGSGRETMWRFENLQVEKAALLVPRPPLDWLHGGIINARVDDRWSLTEDRIDMDWTLQLRGIEVRPPDGAGVRVKLAAGALDKLLKARGGDADFRYRLNLGAAEIEAIRAGDLEHFWDVVLSGLIRDGARAGDDGSGGSSDAQAGQDAPAGVDAPAASVLDRAKSLFRRKDKAGEGD
jgi:hypothetical protein